MKEFTDAFRSLESTTIIPWEADAETWEFTSIGLEAVDLFGYPPEKWREAGFWENHIHPDDRESAIQYCLESSQELKNFQFEYRMMRADESLVWIHDLVSVEFENGKPKTLNGFMIDVTSQKLGEKASRESQEQFRRLVEAAPDGIILINGEGVIRLVNRQIEILFGYPAAELLGKEIEALLPERFRAKHVGLRNAYKKEGTTRPMGIGLDHLVGLRKDGAEFPVEIGLSPFQTSEGDGVIGIVRDNTQRKQAEESLRSAYEEIKELKDLLEKENLQLREDIQSFREHERFIGRSEALKGVLGKVEQVAETDSTVLLLGETGTGKELIAREIHSSSPRRAKAMVTVNCAALPSALIESELFGREKGAYTGAISKEVGRLELADGGTVFFDEIGEMPPETQVKLLRFLQEGEFERLGSNKTRHVDVRVIAATNRDLSEEVGKGAFREDLFFRLNVFPIEVPPLRDREDDIPPLVWSFIEEFSTKMGKRIDSIPKPCLEALRKYLWPGNVRELRNVIERAMILSKDSTLRIDFPESGDSKVMTSQKLEEVERTHILGVLDKTGWRVRGVGGASEILGLKPSTLEYRMAKLGITRKTS